MQSNLFNLLTKEMHWGTDGTLEMHPGIPGHQINPREPLSSGSYKTVSIFARDYGASKEEILA